MTCYLFVTKYFTFQGRSSRKEYILLTILCYSLDYVLGFCLNLFYTDNSLTIALIVLAVTFLPEISVAIRRLHDFNTSGWWIIWTLAIPACLFFYFYDHPIFLEYVDFFIWGMWVLPFILALIKGTPDSNRYGKPPA